MKTHTTLFVVALCAILSPLAQAGTCSVVGIEWYPTTAPGTATGSGYIRFSANNSLDIEYGITSTQIGAPQSVSNGPNPPTALNNITHHSTMQGVFRWKVRWVGDAGEAHPDQVLANAQYRGSSSCATSAMAYSAASNARADVSDPFYPCGCATSSGTPGVYMSNSDANTATPVRNMSVGAGNFTLVAGTTNTWEGYILHSVNSQGSLSASASGGMWGAPNSVASATYSLDATVRLTHIAGQRVQSDL